jgi:putative transposase
LKRKECASLDPGVRTFQTIYSENTILKIRINKELITKLQEKMDKYKSLRDKKIIKKKRYKRQERRINFKLNNLIDDLHHKTISYLTNNFDFIILPIFESQEMVRKIKSRYVNRNLLQLKHYLFQQRLQAKCLEKKCVLHICTEEFTSKTCGRCGELNNVGFSEIYHCQKCNLVIDRDINGSRNIFIKHIISLDR